MSTKRNGKKTNTFKVITRTGEMDAYRCDSAFLCLCGCGKKLRTGRKYFSASCRSRAREKLRVEQVIEQKKKEKSIADYILDLTDSTSQKKENTHSPVGSLIPNENTTLLIQSLLPGGLEK